eukprot:Gb_02273 [translate_table: standard]
MSETRGWKCSNNTYASGSKFEINLSIVLEDLVQKTSKIGFNTSFHGKSPNKVYDLLQCRGDVSQEDCYSCSFEAHESVKGNCPNRIGGRVWLEMCFLRYESYSCFSVLDTQMPINTENPQNVTNETSNSPRKFLSNLSLQAYKPANKGFAVGSDFYFSHKFFGLVQCWRDISLDGLHEDVSNSVIDQHEQMVFSLKTLQAATDNFHTDNKLGEGGFGPVYKERLLDGKEIAVKKLSVRSAQGKREFMNEVKLVAKIQHRNLVKLLDPERRKLLDWEKRYNIIIDIVRGLLYLHQDSQPRIIHRDIKASNILLDENLNPKIADFGLAKIFPEGESHVSTRVAGTYGYMAPEYAMQGQLSVKADVYSFGVLLLEIVSGRKNTDFALLPEMQSLLGWSWRLHKEGHIVDMIDQTLVATCPEEQALRCLQVGLLCAQADAAIRPRMSDVVSMLNSCEKLPDPKKPAFLKYVNYNRNSTGSSGSREVPHYNAVAPSKNALSISDMQPR